MQLRSLKSLPCIAAEGGRGFADAKKPKSRAQADLCVEAVWGRSAAGTQVLMPKAQVKVSSCVVRRKLHNKRLCWGLFLPVAASPCWMLATWLSPSSTNTAFAFTFGHCGLPSQHRQGAEARRL